MIPQTPAPVEARLKALEAQWDGSGWCSSCGWHSAWYEIEDAIREQLEAGNTKIWLVCGSDDDGSSHRGITLSAPKEVG